MEPYDPPRALQKTDVLVGPGQVTKTSSAMLTAAPAAHATPLYAQATFTKAPVPFDSSPRPALASEPSTPVETAANGGTNAAIGDPSRASFSQGEASNTPSQSNNGNEGDNPQQLPDPSQGLVNFSPDKSRSA